ncbi:MAG: cell division protein FtsQ/DivIB [Methyloceanibacter sp.]
MQSLGPSKGRGKARRPTDALLARGIATPTRSFAGLNLPGFGGARRLPKWLPGGAALDRGSGAWRVIVVFVLASAAGYGLWVSGKDGLYGEAKAGVEALAVAAGFGVKTITVEGQQHVTDAELTRALAAGPQTMMLAFDTDAAKARLEQVAWVKHAQVMRLLPSTLQVVIEERVPFAVWQSQGKTYVVDAEGAVIAPAVREAYAGLPLVVGEGAGKNAADLFQTLEPFDGLRKELIAALRVGDRRWTLKLASGVDIMLPDDGATDALNTLIGLDRDRGLLSRNIAAVDLRLADRVSVRLRDGGPAASAPGGAAAPEMPTASTKGNT